MSCPRLDLADFQRAAETGELFLAFQPKLNLRSGEIDGAEALARWQHPRKGTLEPARFVRSAELCGAIDWFTEWVVKRAVSQWSEWRALGFDIEMAVNISALNLGHVDFPDLVERICRTASMPPARLTLELTEGATQEPVPLMDTVARLRLKGMAVSLDDFGTGYASMLQLRKLPFTELKIDRSFIEDLLVSRDSRAITRCLILLAHDLGLSVTAEGVEDAAALDALVALGCDRAQGFLIAPAMTGERFALWLAKWLEHRRSLVEAPARCRSRPSATQAALSRSAGVA